MNEQPEVEVGPVVKVARDLTEILRLYGELHAQAVAKGDDPDMPGGIAMAALGPVASPGERERMIEAIEGGWWNDATASQEDRPDLSHLVDEDETWEPPEQTLRFWSEDIRTRHGYPLDGRRATIETEAALLRWALQGMWRDEPKWEDFAKDIGKARTRLENLLHEGVRSERGVPCMYDECRGVRLVRKLAPARDDDGNKVWKITDWHCPRCKRSWTDERYRAMVTAAHVATQREDIDGTAWVAPEYAARELGRSVKTIRTWINRGALVTVCLIAGRRVKFIDLNEVRERHEDSKKRKPAA